MPESFEALYTVAFGATAVLLFALERVTAFRHLPVGASRRAVSNVSLFLLGNVVSALLIPVGIFAFALHRPPGLVSGSGLPVAVQWLSTFLLLDLWRYWEHRLYHRLPLLWRLHLVHHSDTAVDVTTSERHHPLDLLLATAVLMAVIAALGLPAAGVAFYLIVATLVSLGSHANLRLPDAMDRRVRQLLVTPPFHAVHHSADQAQTDSNYGEVLTVWDRLFGTHSEPATTTIRRFGLDYFASSTDSGIWRVLQQPFLSRHATVEASDSLVATHRPLSDAWRASISLGALGCGLVIVAMWPACRELAAAWRESDAYQWGWLVVPLMVYLLGWYRREDLLATFPRPDFSGVLPSLIGAALWLASDLMNVNLGRELALVMALHGIAMSALGWRLYRSTFATWALLFLMVPSSDWLQPLLRQVTVRGIEVFAVAAHLPHRIDGFAVAIGARHYVVVDECSGLAYVTLATFLGHAFGLLLYRSIWKVGALALFGAALGVLCNLVRVNAIVAIDWWNGSQMDLGAHGDIQWVALFATLGLLLYTLSRLRGDALLPVVVDVQEAPPSMARRLAPAMAGIGVLAAVGGANALLLHTPVERVSHSLSSPAPLPSVIAGRWQLREPPTWSEEPDQGIGSLTASYALNGHQVQITLVEALSPNAKLPSLQLPEPGTSRWRDLYSERHAGCDPAGCWVYHHAALQGDRTSLKRQLYSTYLIGSRFTDSALRLRVIHAWNRLTGRIDDRRSIAMLVDGEPLGSDEVARAMRELSATR